MTPEQQQALVEAARAALVWMSPDIDDPGKHAYSCFYWRTSERRLPLNIVEKMCDCGLWETREGLRAALEAAERDA